MSCRMFVRIFSTRSQIRKSLESVKKTSVSRSSQVGEIHRRLADFEREGGNSTEKSNEYEVSSMLGENYLRQSDEYEKIKVLRQRESLSEAKEETPFSFPYGSTTKVSTSNDVEAKEESSRSDDRGFYVEAGMLIDEYVAGSSIDVDPGDPIVSSCQYYGSDDAVEHISFQLPGQSLHEKSDDTIDPEIQALESSGTVDEDFPVSSSTCSGCGANFHCKDSSLPGFLPLEVLEKVEKKKNGDHDLCKRCHLLQNHNFLLNVNVCPVDYTSMMSVLKKTNESLVLLVVDVTDLPGSIYPKLAEVIGTRKPVIVIGNKVDLLPPDAQTGYMYRFKKTVERAVEKAGLLDEFHILHTALISAKTGYGVEDLITEIQMKYTNVKLGMRGDIFLVGCTNAGKSTLFNALLQSDLCKVRAVDLVDRATTSIWPGTTMSLLKFPVMKPSPYKLEMRRRRLVKHRAWLKKEMYARKLLLQETGDDQYAIPIATIQNTYKESEEDLQPMALNTLNGEFEEEENEKNRKWSLKDPIFANGKWCFDTPGTVNENQLLDLFTLEELMNVVPRRVLKPRTCIVKAGESLLIGGVARLDVEKSDGNVLMTTFVNDKLPLNTMETNKVDEFLGKWLGTSGLAVPCGGPERMSRWPEMKSRIFDMKGRKGEGCCDVVLSSIGWVMVTSEEDVIIRAHVPEGRGLTARIQPILPYSASLRGKRIPGTNFYKVQPIAFPVNQRRKKANARKYNSK